MTTAPNTKEVKITLAGSGKITIDWGDGTKDSLMFSVDTEEYSHTYSNSLAHTVTIIGENISRMYCIGNQLTKLNVSKNTRLTILDCSNNQLKKLDISKNTALRKLNCDNNQITSLNVSENNMSLASLSCIFNNFSKKALNTLFENLHNKKIIYNGVPKSIDITGNPGTKKCDKTIAEKKGWKVIDKKN
jgi:Leucine-rich repeat (LRR) protein